ncbi:hypothetical protein [Streptosporangium sp. NPDC051022]|uniref:hypothetical protein n=1 Tax=Streptosporangium sp. NPDC051022 TaxID=3155752 RepID=UPI0034329085
MDHRGRIVGCRDQGGAFSRGSGTIGIEAPRRFRVNARRNDRIRDFKTERYRPVHDRPIHPEDLCLDRGPYGRAEFRTEVVDRRIKLMHERDIRVRPEK